METPLFPEMDLTDYSQGAFIRTYDLDGARYYASFHEEFFEDDDGIEPTGRYYIVLLHPTGMHHFYLKHGPDDNWFEDCEGLMVVTSMIGQPMIEWLDETISGYNM